MGREDVGKGATGHLRLIGEYPVRSPPDGLPIKRDLTPAYVLSLVAALLIVLALLTLDQR